MSEIKSGKTDMEENPASEIAEKLSSLQVNERCELSEQSELTPGFDEAKIHEFGLLTDMKATEDFLNDNPDFINETTALALLRWCSTSAQDCAEFDVVSTQTLYILYLMDLAKQVQIDPIYCVAPFFTRIREAEFYEMFEKEIIPFRERLKSSSWDEVFQEVLKGDSSDDESSLSMASSTDSDSLAVDPIAMYKALPRNLQECIDNEDIDALEAALNDLPDEVAADYMAKFLQAGLFIPIEADEVEEVEKREEEEED